MDYEEVLTVENMWHWAGLLLGAWLVAAVLVCLLFSRASGPQEGNE